MSRPPGFGGRTARARRLALLTLLAGGPASVASAAPATPTLPPATAAPTPATPAPAAPSPMPVPVPGARRAPTPAEEKAFLVGTQALASGDADTAVKAFQEGFAIAQDPAFLVKVGEAQEKKGDAKAAAAAYRRYLTLVPDASDADEMRARADKLDPSAAAAASSNLAASGTAAGGAAPSPSTAAGSLPGASPTAGAPTLPRAQVFDLGEIKPEVRLEEQPRSALNVAAWIGAGTTVALLGVAAFYGAQAGSKKDDVNRLQLFTDPQGRPLEYASVADEYEAARRDGRHDDRVAKAFLWSAAATGAVTIALFVVDALRSPEEPAVKRQAEKAGSWRLAFGGANTGAGAAQGLTANLSVVLP